MELLRPRVAALAERLRLREPILVEAALPVLLPDTTRTGDLLIRGLELARVTVRLLLERLRRLDTALPVRLRVLLPDRADLLRA